MSADTFTPGSFWATEPITRGRYTARAEYDPFSPPSGGPDAIARAMDDAISLANVDDNPDAVEWRTAYDDTGAAVSQAHAFEVRVTLDDPDADLWREDGCPVCTLPACQCPDVDEATAAACDCRRCQATKPQQEPRP